VNGGKKKTVGGGGPLFPLAKMGDNIRAQVSKRRKKERPTRHISSSLLETWGSTRLKKRMMGASVERGGNYLFNPSREGVVQKRFKINLTILLGGLSVYFGYERKKKDYLC